ncbi:hypothetical protein [Dyadobacter sp. 676]|uniref:Nucleotidyltransferase family protein n=1 Tax=Dyadobacter sp. 676 TaxID=3088362 RepID=A0AAU8FGY5_9BACT
MLFNQYVAILQKHRKQLQLFQVDLDKLNEIKKTLVTSAETFTYTFSNIRVVIPKVHRPSHTIPRNIGDIDIVLSIKDDVVIKRRNESVVEDPLQRLKKFNMVLSCGEYTSSWHLDRHEWEEGPNHQPPKTLHPFYHLTFGGYHMEDLQVDDHDFFGNALIVRSPRIMHPPMELILGLDFVFNHFIPRGSLDLLQDRAYTKIVKDLKRNIWMPFALAIAKNYCNNIEIDGTRLKFDERFVASIITC